MHAWRRRWRHKENKLTEEEEQKTVPKSASLSTRAAVAGGRLPAFFHSTNVSRTVQMRDAQLTQCV
jgi:hypothetical protein